MSLRRAEFRTRYGGNYAALRDGIANYLRGVGKTVRKRYWAARRDGLTPTRAIMFVKEG